MIPAERIRPKDPPEWRAVHRAVRDTLDGLAAETPTIVASLLSEHGVPITDQLTVSKALIEDDLTGRLADVFQRGAGPTVATHRLSYLTLRAQASGWARANAGSLVRSISLEQRAQIALRVSDTLAQIATRRTGASFAVPRLDDPRTYRGLVEQATRRIRPLVGLTPAQMGYVENYRRELERSLQTGNYRAPNARRLSANIKRLNEARIDKLVAQYGERWRSHRAATIAATETHRALQAGQREALEIAARSGRNVPTGLIWVGGTCGHCAAMTGQIVDVIGGRFTDRGSLVAHPPLHPFCRCSLAPIQMEDSPTW